MEDADLDDVPPLEDMSEAFSNSLKLRGERKSKVPIIRSEVLEVPHDAEKQQSERIEKLLGNVDSDTMAKSNEAKKKKNTKKANSSDGYCGFKKGFLTASSKESNNNRQEKEKDKKITEVTKKVDEQKNVLSEVQEAITQQMPFLKSNDWVTENLLSKISSNPKLLKQFTDPRFSDVIQQFQSNPQHVMRMCENNPEMREFIQDFCSIMGEHFTELGDKQDQKSFVQTDKQTKKSSCSKKNISPSDDEEKMKSILSDPEISAILKTVEIQKLFRILKEEPAKAERLLKSADGPLRQKIQRLVDVGLLRMSTV